MDLPRGDVPGSRLLRNVEPCRDCPRFHARGFATIKSGSPPGPRALSPVRPFAHSPFRLLAQYLEGFLNVVRAQNQKPALRPG